MALFVLSIPGNAVASPVVLDEQEQKWLKQHPILRFAPDPAFAPFEWFNHVGDYQGITSDYIRLLQQKLGIKIEIIHASTWKTAINMAKNRQVDVLTAISRTPTREAYLLFSQPYIVMKGAIISNQELPEVRSLADLSGYKVAVVEGYRWDEELTAMVSTDFAINRFHDLQTALTSTLYGVTDVTISAVESARHIQRMEGFVDLNMVVLLPPDINLNFGIRKDWPLLQSILNKCLASISAEQKTAIRNKWLPADNPGFWLKPVHRYLVLVVFAMILVITSVVLIWNRVLNSEVQRRSRELEQAQALLMQAEKMESIGRLAAGVAHEVKNPLAIIQMGVDYLSQELPADDTSLTVIADIDDAVLRADRVIKDLLDFSRDTPLQLIPSNLNKIIKQSLHLVNHEMRQRNIAVIVDLSDNIPDLDLDANKLQQVLINLFMNAAHAMQRNGKLNVRCYSKILSHKSELVADHEHYFKLGESVLWLEVGDTGPGIKQQDHARIFDPFYTTKAVGEGTGLGLSVSRNIINLHHATIDIHNRAEGGAMVVLMFKLNAGEKK